MSRDSKSSGLWDIAKTVIYAVLIALVVRTVAFEPFNIPSGSMKPTLLIGDYLFVSKYSYGYSRYSLPFGLPVIPGRILFTEPERGDVAVFKLPADNKTDFIKRIIGLPGETLEVRDKRVYIDGAPLGEPYLPAGATRLAPGAVAVAGRDNHGPLTIPAGHYFAMGDNRDDSEDSRFWGPLPYDHIKGKAVIIYWSYDAGVPVVVPEPGLGAAVRRLGSVAVHFFTRTRWERMFHQVR